MAKCCWVFLATIEAITNDIMGKQTRLFFLLQCPNYFLRFYTCLCDPMAYNDMVFCLSLLFLHQREKDQLLCIYKKYSKSGLEMKHFRSSVRHQSNQSVI